jgi:hypothetical protein
MKLSRSGWNNVIIFSVMLIILVINFSNDKLFSKNAKLSNAPSQELSLLGEHAVILSLTINSKIRIERIGTNWRATPAIIAGQALEQMMSSWQNALGNQTSTEQIIAVDAPRQIRISVALANQTQPTELLLLPNDDMLTVVNITTQHALQLPLPIYRQLMPFELP